MTNKSRIKNVLTMLQINIAYSACNKIIVLIAFTLSLLAISGTIFGWSGLLVILIEEGAYKHLCVPIVTTPPPETPIPVLTANSAMLFQSPIQTPVLNFKSNKWLLQKDSIFAYGQQHTFQMKPTTMIEGVEMDCSDRDLRYALIFTLCVFALNVCQLPAGILLDVWGSRIQCLVGAIIVLMGNILFIFADSLYFDTYIPAALLCTVGGFSFYLGLLPQAGLFAPHIGVCISLFAASFDSSTIVYLIFLQVWKATGVKSNVLFACYAVIPAFIIILNLFWPRVSRKKDMLLGKEPHKVQEAEKKPLKKVLKFEDYSFMKQIFSFEFFCCIAFYIHTFWIYSFLGGIDIRLTHVYPHGDAEVGTIFELLSWILPCTFFFSPILGLIIDKGGFIVSVCIFHVLYFTLTLLLFIEGNLFVYAAIFFLFTITKSFFFGIMSSYFFATFGVKNFGKIFGTIAFLAGILGLLQYLMYYVVVEYFDGKYTVLDITQIVTLFPSLLFLGNLVFKKIKTKYYSPLPDEI